MHTIKVDLKNRSYNIIIGKNILRFLGKYIAKLNMGSSAYIITNAYIKNKYGAVLNDSLKKSGFNTRFKLVADTEKSKSMDTAFSLIKDLINYSNKKRIFLVALGGGVIGDLTGFVAAIYKRGIPYIQIPTTLLAQIDSAIGGKAAIDLNQGKNLVGAFYQPRLVFSDISVLNSLNLKQLRSGLAEAIKYGIIKDPVLFKYLEKNYQNAANQDPSTLEFIIKRSSRIKALIVKQDEREERGIRTILNFGHTLGHAIEAAGEYKKYTHGEAVALGALLACDISSDLRLINRKILTRIENLIKNVGLPTKIGRKTCINKILKACSYDKKFTGAKNKFVLLTDIGKTKIIENIPLDIIKKVLQKRI